MTLTPEQQQAVDLRGRSVTVSAAAGAGKTRILVERLMGYVLEDGRNIDEFLVVTYTRAAAGELRARVFTRLRELLAVRPGDAHLLEQLTRIYTANIGTLDSYCRGIILENAALAGLPNGYRAGDEAEMELLRARVMDETLDLLYERADADPSDPFRVCAETYGDERGDYTLSALILHIWQKTRCHADPMGWLSEKTLAFGGDPCAVLFAQALCIAETFLARYAGIRENPYTDVLRQDTADIEALIAALNGGNWDETSAMLENYSFARLNSAPKSEAGEAAKALRDGWKKALSAKIRPLIFDTSDTHLQNTTALRPLLNGLTNAVEEFDKALMTEKMRLAVLDFTDVQRLALKLLQDKPPAQFTEILADEFQDINPLQDAIITALSRDGENIFYVGDTRQSIYRFQMAEPSIFQEKLANSPCKVLLTRNFRSAKPILDAVNHVFSRIDCPEMGRLQAHGFLEGGPDSSSSSSVELLVPAGDEDASEPELVARRLRELIESGEAEAGDCVVLMRSHKSRAPEYAAALKAEGLTPSSPSGGGYFSRPEILTMLSALEAINNARLDVPLISILRSPIAGCSPDDLASLRLLSDGPLSSALPLSEDPKIAAFYQMLEAWRAVSADLPPCALAARVMSDSAFPSKVSASACENLLLLPGVLRGYQGDLQGLPDWLRKQDAPAGEAAGNVSGGIRIMSIHSSKGLEFPVVAVAGLSKRLNLQDAHARLLAHSHMGIGLKLRQGYTETPTPSYRAVQSVVDSETRAEELRLLYVAMTRAQKRLILSAGALPETAPPQAVTKGDLILDSNVAAWLMKVRSPDWQVLTPSESGQRQAFPDAPRPPDLQSGPCPQKERGGWTYPHAEAVAVPSKMTATGINKLSPSESGHEASQLPRLFPDIPSPPDTQSGPHAAAERGTATHLFLQFADFSKPVQAEKERLLAQHLISPEHADAIDTEAVERFLLSPRAKTLLKAEGMRREQKFSLLVQNGDLPCLPLPPGEKVLLQGVVDCFYQTPEGAVLLDFKTDRVAPGSEELRAEAYRSQIEAYSFALSAITGKPVAERVLIFLSTGKEVKI
jgi:ATP-dependent helicase/nuclease subunit A